MVHATVSVGRLLLVSVRCGVGAVDQKVKIVASPKIPKAADAAKHKAGGGNVEICQSAITAHVDRRRHNCAVPLLNHPNPASSCVTVDQRVKVVAEAKIPKAADASKHKAGGGNVEICQPPTHSAPPRRGTANTRSLSHEIAARDCCGCCARAVDQKVKIVAVAKIPKATDAAKHKAGGGNVEICQSTQAA